MAGIPGWRARSGQAGLVAVVGALSVGAPILGPPVPVGHASAGGSWPADVTPQQVAVDRGHHHAVGAGAPGITDTLNDRACRSGFCSATTTPGSPAASARCSAARADRSSARRFGHRRRTPMRSGGCGPGGRRSRTLGPDHAGPPALRLRRDEDEDGHSPEGRRPLHERQAVEGCGERSGRRRQRCRRSRRPRPSSWPTSESR
jgi:hypothetical protein